MNVALQPAQPPDTGRSGTLTSRYEGEPCSGLASTARTAVHLSSAREPSPKRRSGPLSSPTTTPPSESDQAEPEMWFRRGGGVAPRIAAWAAESGSSRDPLGVGLSISGSALRSKAAPS